MKNLYIDPDTKDITVQNNQIRLTATNTEWLSSKIEHNLATYYKEFFANRNLGLPYLEQIFIKQPSMATVQSIFSNKILEVEGVEELLSFNAEFDSINREYLYDFVVLSTEGTEISGGNR